MDEQKSHGNNGFVVGVVVGVATTLFLTSKKGKELLSKVGGEGEDILAELEKLLDEGKATVKKAKHHLSPFEKKVERKVSETTTHAKEAIEAVVEKMEEVKDSSLGERVTGAVEDLKKLELVETAQEKLAEMKEAIMTDGESSKKPRRFFKRATTKKA